MRSEGANGLAGRAGGFELVYRMTTSESCVRVCVSGHAGVPWRSLEVDELAARWQEERQQLLATDADVTLG